MIDFSVVTNRANGLKDWLTENHPEVFKEQRHLNEGSVERAYWHHGYMVAIRDIERFLTVGSDEN